MRNKIKAVLLVQIILTCFGSAFAQGTAFTYQGQLSSSGNPASGVYDLKFALYDASSAGTQQGLLLTNTAISVSNGLFTATLDFGNQFPGANRWLEIGVRTNGGTTFTTLMPRQSLSPTPYAIFAGSSSNLTGNVAASQISGNIAPANIGAGSITGTMLAPGAVSTLGAADGSPVNAVQVDTNGLVGIGTTNPVAGLQITTGAPITITKVLFEVQDGTGRYTNLSAAFKPAVSGNLLAVSSIGDSAITLMNIANPANPVLLNQIVNGTGVFTNLAYPEGMAWAGSNLIVAAVSSSAVTILSVSNSSSPVKLAELRDGFGGWNNLGGASSVAVSGNLLAIGALSDSAVTLVDISNLSSPMQRSSMLDGTFGFTNLAGVTSVALNGNLLAIGSRDDNAVTLVNVADPSNPIKLAEMRNGINGFSDLQSVASVSLSGNLLAIGAYYSVTLVDVSNPANPVKLAELLNNTGGYDVYQLSSVALSGNRLAITTEGSSTVSLVDISNPANPVLLAKATAGVSGNDYLFGAEGVAFAGTNLAVTSYFGGSIMILGVATQTVSLASANWVGIGTTHPLAALDVVGNVVVENANLFNVTANHLAMGEASVATGGYSVAIGNDVMAGGYAAAAFGSGTIATGDYSTALGYNSQATNTGSLVWMDESSSLTPASTNNNSLTFRASGGYRLFSNSGATAGAFLAANSTAWATISDQNSKKNFAPVNGESVLAKLANVPVEQWNYKWEKDSDVPNIGPMAQAFKAAFYPGRDDRSITTLEFDGVELAAIQGLNKKMETQCAENLKLKQQNDLLAQRLNQLEATVKFLTEKK